MAEPKKKGRKPKRAGWRVGGGDSYKIDLPKADYPHIPELLAVKNPKELREKYGIELPEDIPWPPTFTKGISQRIGAILETIARRKKEGDNNEKTL